MLACPRPRPEATVDFQEGLHRPVLLEAAVEWLHPTPGSLIVDATLGAGGHAEALLEAIGPEGRLFGIDRDAEALAYAARRLERFGSRFVPLHGNHGDLQRLLAEREIFAVDGVLADLGVSSLQLDDPARGFSFRADGPLDMRMDRSALRTAADLVSHLPELELRRIFKELGEENRAASIARAIVRERERAPIVGTARLAELVERVAGPAARRFRIHPATRTFQALRIALNEELDSIGSLVNGAVSMLRRGGRLVVISFHSLEDRAVKENIRALAERCICPPGLPVCGCGRENLVRILNRRIVVPTAAEIDANPRSRSARLRAVERI